MDYNYHTHTRRCGHASGRDEEYIVRAIEGGIKHMGFSDHAPFVFPDGTESSYRVQMHDARNYFESLNELRKKYKDKIDIKIGFEMEYYPAYFKKMLKTVTKLGAEYLILGQHYVGDERPNGFPSTRGTDDCAMLRSYADCVVHAMESGVFSYVAHPDIIKFCGDDNVYLDEMSRICKAAISTGTPLEINFLGIRDGRAYPNALFWELAGELGAPVTFGFDAHLPLNAYDPDSIKIAEDMVKKYKLNYIGMPKIKSII